MHTNMYMYLDMYMYVHGRRTRLALWPLVSLPRRIGSEFHDNALAAGPGQAQAPPHPDGYMYMYMYTRPGIKQGCGSHPHLAPSTCVSSTPCLPMGLQGNEPWPLAPAERESAHHSSTKGP